MASLEEKAIADMRTPPKLWLRFLDDILAIIKKNLAKEILDHLNRQDPNIVFTMELDEKRSTAVFRLNDSSFRPKAHHDCLPQANPHEQVPS